MYRLFIIIFLSIVVKVVIAQEATDFSFLVAGHAYGAHEGENLGLHPPFLEKLEQESDTTINFLVLTGDIVNSSTNESWTQVANELKVIGIDSYYVMGNHGDNATGYAVFNEKHGGTWYRFSFKRNLFVVLNSTISGRSISDAQLEFLDSLVTVGSDSVENIFVFFHEILWNSLDKYQNVLSNSRSRYANIRSISNYWSEVHPVLTKVSCPVFVIAGDVGGNADAISAFYDQWQNVTLIASGMGEVEDENYLKVRVESGSVNFELIPLQADVEMKPLEFYSVPNAPDSIFGPLDVLGGSTDVQYEASVVFNATDYEWKADDNILISSDNRFASISFENDFAGGELKVRAINDGFGFSSWKSINIKKLESNSADLSSNCESIKLIRENDAFRIEFNTELEKVLTVQLIDISGQVCSSSHIPVGSTKYELLELPTNKAGLYFVRLHNGDFNKLFRVFIR